MGRKSFVRIPFIVLHSYCLDCGIEIPKRPKGRTRIRCNSCTRIKRKTTRKIEQTLNNIKNRGWATKKEAVYLYSIGVMRDIQDPLTPEQRERVKENLAELDTDVEYQKTLQELKEQWKKL